MKKLVMFSAIVAATVSVHAATFTWGGAVCAEDGVSTVPVDTMTYLLYSDTAFGTISSFNTSTLTTDKGGTKVDQHAITATDVSAYAFAENYENDWDKMNGYYAVVMVSGDDMYYNTFAVNEFVSAQTPQQDYKVNADWSGSDYLGDPSRKGTVAGGGSGGGGQGGIPEPTSGLLLLVGGAMLALRRKQKCGNVANVKMLPVPISNAKGC